MGPAHGRAHLLVEVGEGPVADRGVDDPVWCREEARLDWLLLGRRGRAAAVWKDGSSSTWCTAAVIYTVLADSDAFGQSSVKVDDQTGDSLCCASVPEAQARCC